LLISPIKVKFRLRKVLPVERALKHFPLIAMFSLQDGTNVPATERAFIIDEVKQQNDKLKVCTLRKDNV